VKLRAASPEDAPAIAALYAPFVEASHISFETEPPGAEEIARRMESGGDLYPWLAAVDEDGALLGYAYATAFRPRPAYRYAVETTVYVRDGAEGRGLGTALYRPLLDMLRGQGFTQAFAAISLPNEASVRLHERFGFRSAGRYEKVGWKFGRWWDVGLWQLTLAERTEPAELRPWREVAGA
jgi:L-amino acid N-acyltransferase YncA